MAKRSRGTKIDPGLAGRVALVTGANQGIGAAVARALAAHGAAVFLNYLRLAPGGRHDDPTFSPAYRDDRAAGADAVVAAIRAAGGDAEAWEGDLAQPPSAAELFDRAEAAFGPVEVLVNNAAAWQADSFAAGDPDKGELGRFDRRLAPLSASTYDHHFAVNSRATALLIAELARRHQARWAKWGRIISITTGGAPGFPEEVSYGASKNALESFTVAAAWELGRFGVTANVLSPPPTDTGWVTAEVAAAVVRTSPLGHLGRPEEVAEVAVFLASHQARFITGQKITMS